LYTTLTAVVQGMVITAAMQGVFAGIGYWLIGGVRFSLFLGFITGLASFLPLAGPALVWAGTAIYLALSGHVARAIGLAVWGALVVSTADNWIKPLVIGGRAKLPTFPLLIAILGGLQVYGFLGVFVGPVLLAILFVFIDIYRDEYAEGGPLIVEPTSAPPPERMERVASS
jgi:predicted PurR-regulated permease PerM